MPLPASWAKALRPVTAFVQLHGNARDLTQHLAGGEKLFRRNIGLIWIAVATHSQRHDNLFRRLRASAILHSINGAFPCRAPAAMAAMLLATAMPRSL